jgi:hypothetical protein
MSPAKSRKQANLMRAALHGASFPKARAISRSMTAEQLKDFARLAPHTESYSYDFRQRNNLKQNRRG